MRVRRTLVAGARGLGLAVVAPTGSLPLFVLTVVSVALLAVGVGVLTTPLVVGLARKFADLHRVWGHDVAGLRIPAAYRPYPPGLRGGPVGQWRRCAVLLRDPATWRELLWLLVQTTAGFALALLPPTLIVYGAGLVLLPLFDALTGLGDTVLAMGPVLAGHPWAYVLLPLLGAGLLVLAVRAHPALLRAHFQLAAAFLTPPKTELTERVAQLTASRHDAVDVSAAELRRIERDLHDGAQARLVAMGMSLGAVEALIEKDPARAREILGRARESSAQALTELRDLVRGIHPPVLAERGLGDAVRALALRMELPVEVTVELPGRVAAPVESAAYFAVSELLTNAAKHSGADRVWVDVHLVGGLLRISVTDDGQGGAVLPGDGDGGRDGVRAAADGSGGGSGLRGVARRLGTFDGILAVSSPVGGPTLVTLEIPCA